MVGTQKLLLMAYLIYTYSNGVKASFTCLTSNAKDDYQIKVMGDKATVIIILCLIKKIQTAIKS